MADAEAICEAVGRPNMRFVPIKNVEQQAILSMHRARQAFVKGRTAQANQMRSLLSEFGIVILQGSDRQSNVCRIYWKMPRTVFQASCAIVATAGSAREFKNGRQLSAWFELVSKQRSSGGKQTLFGKNLRTLLIHGARSVIRFAKNKAEPESWLRKLMARRNKNVAAVALANKNTRIIWALLARDKFHPNHTSAASAAKA